MGVPPAEPNPQGARLLSPEGLSPPQAGCLPVQETRVRVLSCSLAGKHPEGGPGTGRSAGEPGTHLTGGHAWPRVGVPPPWCRVGWVSPLDRWPCTEGLATGYLREGTTQTPTTWVPSWGALGMGSLGEIRQARRGAWLQAGWGVRHDPVTPGFPSCTLPGAGATSQVPPVPDSLSFTPSDLPPINDLQFLSAAAWAHPPASGSQLGWALTSPAPGFQGQTPLGTAAHCSGAGGLKQTGCQGSGFRASHTPCLSVRTSFDSENNFYGGESHAR